MQDSLRTLFDRALDDEPPQPPGELAREAMASGKRLRGRRRLLAGGGAAGFATVLVAVIAVGAARTPAPEPADAVAMAMRPAACTETARKLVEAVLFLRADVTDRQRADLDELLRSDARVLQVRYESRQAAYAKFKEMYRDAPDLVASVKPEHLPESFRVKLARPSGYATFVKDVEGRPGVETAVVGECPEQSQSSWETE
ncbi:permease-like cell division protein FtsX [Micromonospora sp. CPCC 206061]|uniref:permease-like cell division protein FtsX n=1 Tax=Micromonospora sp. CPCC 206061 TaxID=3122410 RepID=UPI002FF1FDA1